MRIFLFMSLALILAATAVRADDTDPEPLSPDKKKLLGEWEVVDLKNKVNNIPFPIDQIKITITFQKDCKLSMEAMGQQKQGTWKIDAKKSPRHLDMTQDHMPAAAIYKFDKETLVIGTSEGQGKDRPKNFESAQMIITLKRVKKQ